MGSSHLSAFCLHTPTAFYRYSRPRTAFSAHQLPFFFLPIFDLLHTYTVSTPPRGSWIHHSFHKHIMYLIYTYTHTLSLTILSLTRALSFVPIITYSRSLIPTYLFPHSLLITIDHGKWCATTENFLSDLYTFFDYSPWPQVVRLTANNIVIYCPYPAEELSYYIYTLQQMDSKMNQLINN